MMIRPVLPIRPFISVSISAAHLTSASCVIGAACLITADRVIGAGAQVKPGDVFRRPPVRPPLLARVREHLYSFLGPYINSCGDVFRRPPVRPPPLPAMTGQMPVKSIPDPSPVTVGGTCAVRPPLLARARLRACPPATRSAAAAAREPSGPRSPRGAPPPRLAVLDFGPGTCPCQ